MKYTKDTIIAKLRDYPRLTRMKRQIEFELSLAAPKMTDAEIISSMALPSPQDYLEGRSGGTDRTANTALNYRDEAEGATHELAERLSSVTAELTRMDFYVGLLNEKYGTAIQTLYFNGKTTNKEAATNLSIDEKTLIKRVNLGIAELTDMYNLIP